MTDLIHGSPIPQEADNKNIGPSSSADISEEQNAISTASNGAQNAQITIQALTDRALHFLATASNETLGACLVGLSATTYLVLGRVGLVLIGVVGGVVLHATWEGNVHGNRDDRARSQETRRRETGLDVVHRVLDWRSSVTESKGTSKDDDCSMDVKLYSGKHLDYSDYQPETASALNEFTDAVIRDYVKWWYSPILPMELSFPAAARQTFIAFVLSISAHISRKRPADTFLDFVTNASSIMIVFFNELSSALAASPNATAPDAIDVYLQIKPDSNLANVLDTKIQEKKLDMVAEDILQSYLDPKTYNCRPAHIFLRKVMAKLVLEATLTLCSKPEWINNWIVYLLEEGEPELMNAIDAGVEGSSGDKLQNVTDQIKKPEEILKAEPTVEEKRNTANHKRVVSRAQEAMDEAMREAQRLTQLIAEEDAKRLRDQQQHASSTSINDDISESTTQGIATPTSSQSDAFGENENEMGASTNLSKQTSQTIQPLASDSTPETTRTAFTDFDQLIPSQPVTALSANPPLEPVPLTLYNANISIFDDSMPGDKGTIRNKPTTEYLIQIEPATSQHPGWMIARKFVDFETLHEIIGRISKISGVPGFTEAHASLPAWKGHTKASLRGELERYLNDAVRFKPLAESEGMKRFLEKDSGLNKSPNVSNKSGFGWPTPSAFQNMGTDMMGVLTKAPKNVAGGGKALFGGVTGVLGNVGSQLGPKKNNSISGNGITRSTTASPSKHGRAESTVSELPSHIRTESSLSSFPSKRQSQDSLRGSPVIDTQPAPIPQMERRPSWNPDGDSKPRPSSSSRSSVYGRSSRDHSRAPSARESVEFSPVHGGDQIISLPPLPSDIPDDYGSPPTHAPPLPSRKPNPLEDYAHSHHPSRGSTTSLTLPTDPQPLPTRRLSTASAASAAPPKPPRPSPKTYLPLTEQETQVIIELLFAVINELYTLSSAWQIRRTLLNAAKTFLLRPGNPQLDSIRQLLQSTVLDDNTSDAGIAFQVRTLRANTLPTEEELKTWPKEMTNEEKEKLRVKARRLLVERGMPQALTSVMGQAASGEALGKVFDCLQVQKVARGMLFGLLLQALRAVTQ
ncbi:hypothetical protein K432DRAFT_302579 [Lepidopterella palustris CBS 459.81]|uniref:PXA domain-containing protein n=1 Tax=Lepidopterella palustris CBS 459.81 TaxID=1314670 RepID=A0A8E2JD82_9PEZI|nr:hypothetical protein K432DRAFT_302579 [Lepidopterella palustris CBS 459.81]